MRILVGVDGTAASEPALVWAASEAERCGATLTIVHAWGAHLVHQAPYAGFSWRRDPSYLLSCGSAIIERGAALAQELFPKLGIERRLERGRAAEILLRLAAEADLLVLGASLERLDEGRIGAVLLACLRDCPCPVVMVPPTPCTAEALAFAHAGSQR
ncbi:universal stress protein [Nonomuraea sp. NPDC050536]|uniref:universal stress protein n=1 Tax=Nonomuraea sp. NPDC050536 TaxID=3364366 RepID=UPI0037C76326